MTISEDAKKVIEAESSTLSTVLTSLEAQQKRGLERLSIESARARELTAALVSFRRDEDKQMIASDEAVSHSLRDKKEVEIATLDKLVKQPYFARLILNEETPSGQKRLEYRIGFAENSDCRIIDWRKAPIAKLYYEYKEGESYSEDILGRERVGIVTTRNRVQIENSVLKRISCSLGNFELKGSNWIQNGEPVRSRNQTEGASDGPSSYHLPQVASLLSPEQFQLVGESGDSALLIQGVAGSGKTTVALHRMAWLIGSGKEVQGEPLLPSRCAVVVLSAALKEYVSKALPGMGVDGVTTCTLREWLGETVARALPSTVRPASEFAEGSPIADRIARPRERCPQSIDRLKRSLAMLKAVEKRVMLLSENDRSAAKPYQILIDALDRSDWILAEDDTKLIDAAIVKAAKARTAANKAANVLDYSDDALLVRIVEMLDRKVFLKDGTQTTFQHLVADEVQDFSPVDLACIIGAVGDPRGLTLIGDTAQKIDASSAFPGWDKLRRHWAFKESMSTFMSLNLSQRSTQQILKLADHIQQRPKTQQSKAIEGRMGRVPIWFKCLEEGQGVTSVIDWLTRASQKYPGSLAAVLCRDTKEAKYVYRLLQPTFGPLLRMGDDASFTFYEGIVVTSAEHVKGLEFTNVLIWNRSKESYPRDEHHRNLLYTAVTRAEENLALVTWTRPSEILPGFASSYFRAFDLTIRDEEEKEERVNGD